MGYLEFFTSIIITVIIILAIIKRDTSNAREFYTWKCYENRTMEFEHLNPEQYMFYKFHPRRKTDGMGRIVLPKKYTLTQTTVEWDYDE